MATGVRLHIFAQPNGKKSEVLGEHDGSLKVRIQAPPVEGKANDAVEEFIAKLFSVSKKTVQIVRGQLSRHKVIEIQGLSLSEAREKLKRYLK
jgi:uncharacterized protein (TIGR00251 family)